MPITEDRFRAAIANFLAGKVREFGYQLRVIVEACDQSLASYRSGGTSHRDGPLVYAFSAFGNAMQSLKDALKTIGGEAITWSQIGRLSHGEFMAKSRNAMTHDGNPVINAWADGRYFVATNISRFGSNGAAVEIERPQADVRTLCLRFAAEFSTLLATRLHPLIGEFQIGGSGFDSDEIEEAIVGAGLIPAEVKSLFLAHKEQFRQSIAQAPPIDPVANTIRELEILADYCTLALNE